MDGAQTLGRKVVTAYSELGGLAYGYGEGSLFAGFDPDAGLDLVLVWDRSSPPDIKVRPVDELADGSGVAIRFHQRDRFFLGGRQVHVSHRTRQDVESWFATVREGRGWELLVHPTPLYAVAGFAYGVLLEDGDGIGRIARDELLTFPDELRERSRKVLTDEMSARAADLTVAARRGDGWLFHEWLGGMHRHAMVSWFAAHQRYCPYPKWLHRWAARFGLDPRVGALERGLWAPPVSLHSRLDLFRKLVDRVLTLP